MHNLESLGGKATHNFWLLRTFSNDCPKKTIAQSGRVTRCVLENTSQNEDQPIFVKLNMYVGNFFR
jgi:hypothetical protein